MKNSLSNKTIKYNIIFWGVFMKIRDHPNLVHWPPKWIAPFGNESLPSEKMEELVLKEVELLNTPINDYHCYIRILAEIGVHPWKSYTRTKTWKIYTGTNTAKTYSSIIIFLRDSEFLNCLYQKLQNSIGQTIREIGDSEI
jgi:hypothetical protein